SPLFGHFVGTTRPSDSPSTCMLAVGLKAFANRPAASAPAGVAGVSRFSRVEFPCMPGVSDCAASGGYSRGASVGIAFRHAERRRHAGRDYFAAQYPACMCPVNASMVALRLLTHDSGP